MTSNKSPTRNLAPKLIRLALTVIVLGWVISRVSLTQVIDALRGADHRLILLSMLIFQAGVALRSARWWMLLQGASIRVRYSYVLGLMYVSELFIGAVPISLVGDLARIIEFKRGGSRTITAGIVILDRVLGLTGMLTLVLVALAVGHQQLSHEIAVALAVIALFLLLVIALLLHGSMLRWLIRFIPNRFSWMRENWIVPFTQALTGSGKRDLNSGIILSILNTALTVINHYLVALAVGIQLGIGLFFVFSPTVNLSLMLPTISGLGLRELGYQILLEPFGVSASVAIALGIGVYISRLSASLIGGAYYLLWNLRRG